MECLFCKIIKKEIPSYKVYEDEKFYAFLDISPKTKGHTLLIPKAHVKDLLSINGDEDLGYQKVVKTINDNIVKKLGAKGLTIMSNNGLGQDVPHLHWHLIPRYEAGDFKLVDSIPVNLDALLKKLV